jgi:fructosamine-3-kinase
MIEAATRPAEATAILRAALPETPAVRRCKALRGGMVNRVESWHPDGGPAVVAKRSPRADAAPLRREAQALDLLRRETDLPVPAVLGLVTEAAGITGTALLLEHLPGRHLGAAELSPAGAEVLQAELARHCAALHRRTGPAYGFAPAGEAYATWREDFGPQLQSWFAETRARLSATAQRSITAVLDRLDRWLPEAGPPTLVHGDLWATNILVDDSDPQAPRITGFLDPVARYADVESELAYLRVFRTAGETFFRRYAEEHPLRAGFAARCPVYWLNTMLLHLAVFGTEYLGSCERLARDLDRPPPEEGDPS